MEDQFTLKTEIAAPAPRVRRDKDLRGTWTQALLSLFGAILMILSLRWACFEPYVIPSGSMIPTLLIHDHILVNKLIYGLRFPFTSSWVFRFGGPRRGDVIVFRSVEEDGVFLVKRVIGLPGDEVRVVGQGQLLINGQLVPRRQLSRVEVLALMSKWPNDKRDEVIDHFDIYEENLDGRPHYVFHNRDLGVRDQGPYVVAADSLFMMGDNRDNSADSRVWGELPADRILGRASFIWLSCEETLPEASQLCDPQTMRWDRIFRSIK